MANKADLTKLLEKNNYMYPESNLLNLIILISK